MTQPGTSHLPRKKRTLSRPPTRPRAPPCTPAKPGPTVAARPGGRGRAPNRTRPRPPPRRAQLAPPRPTSPTPPPRAPSAPGRVEERRPARRERRGAGGPALAPAKTGGGRPAIAPGPRRCAPLPRTQRLPAHPSASPPTPFEHCLKPCPPPSHQATHRAALATFCAPPTGAPPTLKRPFPPRPSTPPDCTRSRLSCNRIHASLDVGGRRDAGRVASAPRARSLPPPAPPYLSPHFTAAQLL